MNSKPKIIVLKTREIIYTILLALFAIVLILCLFLMFTEKRTNSSGSTVQTGSDTSARTNVSSETASTGAGDTAAPKEEPLSAETAVYTAGIYTTPITLGDSTVDVEVTVDQNHINAIRLVNLSESTAAAYPLVTPSLEHITSQILINQSLENITCPQENRYTSQLLLSAVSDALAQAQKP